MDPDFLPAHTLLASIHAQLGRLDEAQAQAAEVLKLNPRFSLTVYRQNDVLKDQAVVERLMNGLRKAGLPE
jgi:adenylate cyclase